MPGQPSLPSPEASFLKTSKRAGKSSWPGDKSILSPHVGLHLVLFLGVPPAHSCSRYGGIFQLASVVPELMGSVPRHHGQKHPNTTWRAPKPPHGASQNRPATSFLCHARGPSSPGSAGSSPPRCQCLEGPRPRTRRQSQAGGEEKPGPCLPLTKPTFAYSASNFLMGFLRKTCFISAF